MFRQEKAAWLKVGESDDTVPLDFVELSFLVPILEHLSRRPAEEKIVEDSYPGFLQKFTPAAHRLRLRVVPSMGRHSGASIDAAKGYRTIQEVQRHGRWRAAKSVMRYEKKSQLNDSWRALSDDQRNYCLGCAQVLARAILFGELPAVPATL